MCLVVPVGVRVSVRVRIEAAAARGYLAGERVQRVQHGRRRPAAVQPRHGDGLELTASPSDNSHGALSADKSGAGPAPLFIAF